jgi:hypothetical protein
VKIKPFVIERFANWLAGGTAFEAAKQIVTFIDDPDKPGAEKRQAAYNAFVAVGYGLAGWVVNLVIELAVAWLREQQKHG